MSDLKANLQALEKTRKDLNEICACCTDDTVKQCISSVIYHIIFYWTLEAVWGAGLQDLILSLI